jgi:hypothetical protein
MASHQDDDTFQVVTHQIDDEGSFVVHPAASSSSHQQTDAQPTNMDHSSVYSPDFSRDNRSILQIELLNVLTAVQNLHQTANFLSGLGDNRLDHSHHEGLKLPIADLLAAVTSADEALAWANDGRRIGSSRLARENDSVGDKDLFFKWTANCTMSVLGMQSAMEKEVGRVQEWMEWEAERQAEEDASSPVEEKANVVEETEEDEDEDEWELLEKDETGNVHSVPKHKKKEIIPKPTERVEAESSNVPQEKAAFVPDPDWELWTYGQQLLSFRDDLFICVPAAKTSGSMSIYDDTGRMTRDSRGQYEVTWNSTSRRGMPLSTGDW